MKAKRTFNAIFWPAFIELLFFMLMGTIDTLMLSNFNDFAVGAVGNANILINMFAVLVLVISSGVAVLVSQHIGAKQEDEARAVIGTGLFINFFIGIILAGSMYVLGSQLLEVVNTGSIIFNDSLTYLRLMSMSLVFIALSHVMTGTLRSFGFARYVTIIVIIGNLLNIIGNYILINGNFGFPRLGVYGAGLSTLIVRGLMMVIYAIVLFKLINISLSDIKLVKKSSRDILRIGVPSALETWTYTLMQGVIISIINGFGAQYTTARTYVTVLLTYVYVFSLALAQTNAIMTGYAIGEQNYEKAYQQTIKVIHRSFIIVGVITLFINVFPNQILGVFTTNQEILNIAKSVLWIIIFLEISRSVNLITIQALRSSGDARFPLIMAIISMLGVAIPLAFILGKWLGLGLLGIYIAYTADEMLRAIFMALRWRSRKWETKSKYLKKVSESHTKKAV